MTHKHEWLKTLLRNSPKAEFANQYFEALVEQIQLDAMQEGMRRAAVVAKENSELPYGQNPTPYSAILTVVNNLTLTDL